MKTTIYSKIRLLALAAMVFFLFAPLGWAATYYVNATNGQDSNTGLSTATAWKTIAKVNASRFLPGDQILFKRGEIWRETLIVPSSGTLNSQVVFGAYGDGEAPVISGSDLITTWAHQGSAIWWAALVTQPTIVYFNGKKGTQKSDIGELGSEKDWFWQVGTLYIYAPSSPNSLYLAPGVEAVTRNHCVYNTDRNHIIYDNLTLRHTSSCHLSLKGASYNTVKNMKMYGSGQHAVLAFNGGGNHTITNCEIYEIGINGGSGTGSGIQWVQTTTGANVVESCFIHDIGLDAYDHGIYDQGGTRNIYRYNHFKNVEGCGIKVADNTAEPKIYYNIFENCRAAALQINGITGAQVYNNTAYHCGNWPEGRSPYAIYWYLGGVGKSVDFKNNIGVNGGALFHVMSSTLGFKSDYNCGYRNTTWSAWLQDRYNSKEEFFQATGQDAHSYQADPRFVDESIGILRLQEGSPCSNAGIWVGLNRDFIETPVPQGKGVEIGAFEEKIFSPPVNLRKIK